VPRDSEKIGSGTEGGKSAGESSKKSAYARRRPFPRGEEKNPDEDWGSKKSISCTEKREWYRPEKKKKHSGKNRKIGRAKRATQVKKQKVWQAGAVKPKAGEPTRGEPKEPGRSSQKKEHERSQKSNRPAVEKGPNPLEKREEKEDAMA